MPNVPSMAVKINSWLEIVVARRDLDNSGFEIAISHSAINLMTIMIKNKWFYFVLLSVCTTFAIMKKIDFTRIGKGAPYALVTGMVCFVAAYVITSPWIKNSLLLAGLAAVVISVGLYITAWKHE